MYNSTRLHSLNYTKHSTKWGLIKKGGKMKKCKNCEKLKKRINTLSEYINKTHKQVLNLARLSGIDIEKMRKKIGSPLKD